MNSGDYRVIPEYNGIGIEIVEKGKPWGSLATAEGSRQFERCESQDAFGH